MTCQTARLKLAAYGQGQVSAGEAAAIRRHLLNCGQCEQEYEYQARLNTPLRELPAMPPPPELALAIRLRAFSRGLSAWDRRQVRFSNLMRPVALPAAGGLLTALILWAALMPAVSVSRRRYIDDVPTALHTNPRFKDASPLPIPDVLVEAWIDERGRITDFEVLDPPTDRREANLLRQESSNFLLTTVFEPARQFGQPTSSGRVLLLLDRIVIRP